MAFFSSVPNWAWVGFRDWGNNDTYFWLSGDVLTTTGFSPNPWKDGNHTLSTSWHVNSKDIEGSGANNYSENGVPSTISPADISKNHVIQLLEMFCHSANHRIRNVRGGVKVLLSKVIG